MPADHQSAAMTDEQRWAWFEAPAEEAYDKMYDANNSSDAAARYSPGGVRSMARRSLRRLSKPGADFTKS